VAGSRGWWIETRGRRRFLRARVALNNTTKTVGHRGVVPDVSQSGSFVLELDPASSERITWPTGPTSLMAEVRGVDISPGFGTISGGQETLLDEIRQGCVGTARSYEGAMRRLRRLFRETLAERPFPRAARLAHHEAYLYVRQYFARAELVEVDGIEPFEVAACALAETTPVEADLTDTARMPPFKVFKPAQGEHGADWVDTGTSLNGRRALERATRRHRDLLGALACAVRGAGLVPGYNGLVDLHTTTQKCDLLFEVKTAHDGNYLDQVRSSIGQLLEYRYRYRISRSSRAYRTPRLVTVIEDVGNAAREAFARDFLRELGVELLVWRDSDRGFDGLSELLAS
jgi:hypothetical protein